MPARYRELVRQALDEDLGGGDITTNAIVGQNDRARGVLIAKAPCTLAGLAVAARGVHPARSRRHVDVPFQ